MFHIFRNPAFRIYAAEAVAEFAGFLAFIAFLGAVFLLCVGLS